MSQELNNMINQLNVQLAIQRNNAIVEQRRAAAAEAKYNDQAATWQNQFATIQQQNLDATAAAQAAFEKQLEQSRKASANTIAGLEQLLLDQQATAKAQAAQFAEQSALAESRYQEQLQRTTRIQNAYVPENQPTAQAPLVGDSRQSLQPATDRRRGLSQLSIVSNSSGPAGASKGQLSGLQIA